MCHAALLGDALRKQRLVAREVVVTLPRRVHHS